MPLKATVESSYVPGRFYTYLFRAEGIDDMHRYLDRHYLEQDTNPIRINLISDIQAAQVVQNGDGWTYEITRQRDGTLLAMRIHEWVRP